MRLAFILISVLIVNLSGIDARCQSQKIDSLNLLISSKKYKNVNEKLEILDKICNIYIESDLVNAEKFANEILQISSKSSNKEFEAKANESIGRILYLQGRIDSSIIFLKKAVEIFSELQNSTKQLVEAKTYLANSYRITAKYDESIELYNQALKYYEDIDDKVWIAKILANIGSLYYSAGNQAKGEEYTLRALELQRKTKDLQGESVSLVNLVVFALNNGDYQKGIKYGDEAIKKLKPINITYYAAALVRVGYCYYMIGEKVKAISYTKEALRVYQENNSVSGVMESYRTLGDYYYDMKNYELAKNIGLEALRVADTSNRLDLRLIYDLLKRSSIFLNHHEDAINYSQQQIRLKEEDLNSEWANMIADADAKYQTQKKENEIQKLRYSQKIRFIAILSLIFIIVFGLIGALLFMKGLKQKRKIAEQKVAQLEQEKQLIATKSLLEGETTERARLSKDLHDGLGGLLSVTKHKMANMKGSLTIPEEQVETFNSALEMLDNSIKELRRVAHNLMPESLMRYGLSAAIKDFCGSIDKATYHFYGVEKRIDEKLEVAAFRIVSELVNNALKHANASKINVQLVQEQDRISLTVYDDGCGFDLKAIDKTKSVGLNSIEQRVVSFNGRIDILSEPGKGTEITVEFKC